MIDLLIIHKCLDVLIIVLFPIMGIVGFGIFDRFVDSDFKKIIVPLFIGFAIMHMSYTIRAANHLFFELEILRFVDILILMIGTFLTMCAVIKIYKFSCEYGFNVSETTKKLREWVKTF